MSNKTYLVPILHWVLAYSKNNAMTDTERAFSTYILP